MTETNEPETAQPRSASPRNVDRVLAPGQQRILELQDGDSFVLQTILVDEDDAIPPRWRYRGASQIASRLASWARGQHVLIVYHMIDTNSARIWRLGAI